MLKRGEIHVDHKRTHRFYCLEGLHLRPKRNGSASHRAREQLAPKAHNEAWARDSVADQMDGRAKIRILIIVEIFTRECLAATVGR